MAIDALTGCKAYDPESGIDLYGYVPTFVVGIIFTALFLLTTVAHIYQSVWKRRWWTLTFAVGALTAFLGWSARTWSAKCPINLNAFLMQIVTLILAPTFFTAGIYVILGRLIQIFGTHTSPISPAMYLWIFCTCDVISLVVQAVGGGMAATAVAADPPRNSQAGTRTMVAGIVFQMASVTVFAALFIEFLRRVRKSKNNLGNRIWMLVFASAFSCLMIYVRSIYRTIELAQGWEGFLITHEDYFIALDGTLMLSAVVVYNFIHPGWFLPSSKDN